MRLASCYGEDAAARIIAKTIWQGATAEMVVEALGRPEDVSEKVLKRFIRHVYMYGKRGRSYALKITLENGVVVGWEGAAGVVERRS